MKSQIHPKQDDTPYQDVSGAELIPISKTEDEKSNDAENKVPAEPEDGKNDDDKPQVHQKPKDLDTVEYCSEPLEEGDEIWKNLKNLFIKHVNEKYDEYQDR